MTVNVAPGQIAVPTLNNTGSSLCTSDAVEQVTLTAAPPSGQNRIDLIICRPRAADIDGSSNNDFIFDLVTGTPGTTGTIPATPAGTVSLAQVAVAGGVAAITGANITDVRPFALAVGSANGLPPAVITGTAVHAWTDDNGDVWVAKNGVYGGAWRKARDVLTGWWCRNGAYNFPVSATLMVFDHVIRDVYGLYNTGTGLFTCPVAGWYLVGGKLAFNANAAAQSTAVELYINGGLLEFIGGVTSANAAGYHVPLTPAAVYGNAGDTIGIYLSCPSNVVGLTGAQQAFATISYTGTG
jgi:hypothetical protein